VTIARLSIGGSLLSRDGPIRGLVTFGQTFVLRSHSRIAPGPRVVAWTGGPAAEPAGPNDPTGTVRSLCIFTNFASAS
jgi:hypothetical protein